MSSATNPSVINRVKASGSFVLPLSPTEAFELFTAEGEKRWVPGWQPLILGAGPQEPGLVFLTEADGASTVWTVLESSKSALRHRYSRVTPGLHAGLVEVQLSAEGPGTRVHVSYDMTALPGSGPQILQPYSRASFPELLKEWLKLLRSQLDRDQAS